MNERSELRTGVMLVDGENLLARYEEMLGTSRVPNPNVSHAKGRFVWPKTVLSNFLIDRVNYYTTFVGDDPAIQTLKEEIKATPFEICTTHRVISLGHLNPRVFKKSAKNSKSHSVDINIAIDAMRHSYMGTVDSIFLLTGDGDYVPLIEDVMRRGVQVTVGALSSGLHPLIPVTPDSFIDLDGTFFL